MELVNIGNFQSTTKFFQRLWNSPTLMTWGSFFSRSISFVVVLPLVLTKLSAEEIVLWYLFNTILAMQWLLDMGCGSTFSRAISYAMGGASSVHGFRIPDQSCGDGNPNWELLGKVIATMRRIYVFLGLTALLLIGIFGTWALLKPISAVANPLDAWFAWGVILIFYPVTMWGNTYAMYLEGINQIALVRRWDMLTSLAMIASTLIVLILKGGLLELVIVNQAWGLIRLFRNRSLCHWVEEKRFKYLVESTFNKDIFKSLWPATWRSAIGGFMSYGLLYSSSLVVAQVESTAQTASYLLALKFIETISQFSQAPFYSKLPILARKRAQGDLKSLVSIAKRGMILAHWAFVLPFLFIGIMMGYILILIKSHVSFVPQDLWVLMGLAYFLHRFGAMHIQLYSTTNHIVWHIADTLAGLIFITVSLSLIGIFGVYALPIGQICGYLGFYCWYSAKYSYRSINVGFFQYEYRVVIPPLLIMLTYAGFNSGAGLFEKLLRFL